MTYTYQHVPCSRLPAVLRFAFRSWVLVLLFTLVACVPAENNSGNQGNHSLSSNSPSSSAEVSHSSSRSSASGLTLPSIQGGCTGYATRFWDCCKPHCGWAGNMPMGVEPNASCGPANDPLSDRDAQSACSNGNAHTCYGLIPFAMSDTVSYGWAATHNGDICGRCYQIEFTGASFNAGNDPGSAALRGKSMIVQALNIGGDVANSQFDILTPGGGVGLFNACSAQWGVSNNELGAQYGGFLSACKQQLGHDKSLGEYKSCVAQRCDSVFKSRGLTELHQGCMWFVDWFEAADNPSLRYKEVQCPQELINRSGMDRTFLNDIRNSCS